MELYRNRAELQLFTTLKCNLSCSYCSLSEGEQLNSQGKPTYSIAQLQDFVSSCLPERELQITFYGGEPLLNRDFILEVMEAFPLAKFQLQTNGTLLEKTDNEIISRLSNILVSLDGSEKHTDEARGAGVYSKVLAHVKCLSDRPRFTASTIGRVTWASSDTTFEELDEMLKTFDYVYFQFAHQIGAYGLGSLQKRKYELKRMVEKFFTYHSVYCMIPIMGIVRNKLFPHKATDVCGGKTQCRASTHLYNVLPSGDIYACPDMTHMPEMYMGNIAKKELRDSPLQATDKFPCWTCEAYKWCRHTCIKNLHVAYTLGDINHRIGITEPVCELTRFLGREIDKHDLQRYFSELTPADQEHLKNAPVYDYVEIMP